MKVLAILMTRVRDVHESVGQKSIILSIMILIREDRPDIMERMVMIGRIKQSVGGKRIRREVSTVK